MTSWGPGLGSTVPLPPSETFPSLRAAMDRNDAASWMWVPLAKSTSALTVSGLAQSHFGTFDHKTLSASWTSTDNALLARLHVLKDVLSVIDDYAPQDDSRAQTELDRRVQRVLRDVGNRAARGRLDGDLRERPEHPPRGFLLCNGEALPPGHSINARLVHVEVDRRRLDLDAITTMQESAHRLPHAMRAYLVWLTPRLGELKTSLHRLRDELRGTFHRSGLHLRQPEALANLYLGIDLFVSFAVELGGISAPRADEIRAISKTAFQTLAFRQGGRLGTLDDAEVFVGTLAALLLERRVQILDLQGPSCPGDPEAIGWGRGDVALILPEVAYHHVATSVGGSGGRWAPSLRRLHRELVERGYLLTTLDGRNAGQWRVGPDRRKQRGWLREIGWHVLRHTFCSHLAMCGVTASAIKELAGHTSLATTERYMHLSPLVTRTAIAALDRRPRGNSVPTN